jgi:sugar lactone lactonase YvrE
LIFDFYFLGQKIVSSSHMNINRKWKQHGITIAGGNGKGDGLNQLSGPCGLYVNDNDQSIYIADWRNHRIVEWKYDAKNGQVVAGGNGEGNQMNQLDYPTDVIVDEKNDSLIICDQGNSRVVRWPRRNGTNGRTIISDIGCFGLTMDNNGNLYVSDFGKNEVRQWKIGETNGTIVAGGNGCGTQLNCPTYLFVDEDHSVYVSDKDNHCVMKWMKGAKEGIVVAGGQGQGDSLRQLSHPQGVIVDQWGNVYVADCRNHRIMRWSKGSKEGCIVAAGNGQGNQPNQLNSPTGLSFDRQGNLYVVDCLNSRVQKFVVDLN